MVFRGFIHALHACDFSDEDFLDPAFVGFGGGGEAAVGFADEGKGISFLFGLGV